MEAAAEIEKLERFNDVIIEGVALAEKELFSEIALFAPFLKEGETPFERFTRERKDGDALLKVYGHALAEIERLRLDSVRLDYLDKMATFHNGAHICCTPGGLRTAIDFSRAASGANK
jgi:hypothetical protein